MKHKQHLYVGIVLAASLFIARVGLLALAILYDMPASIILFCTITVLFSCGVVSIFIYEIRSNLKRRVENEES